MVKKAIASKRKLKIAQVAPIIERVPPKKYGGTERIVYTLTEELVKRGHQVTLFASGDSQTSANLFSVYPRSLREAKMPNLYGNNELTLLNIGAVYRRQEEFDIIHDHNAPTSLPAANMAKTPTVVTIHGPISSISRRVYRQSTNVHLVAISKAQILHAPDVEIEAVIHHGLDFSNYPFSKNPDNFLLFVGRLSLDKGPHFAIAAAQDLDLPLIMAAKLDSIDLDYYRSYIEPKLSDEGIRWIGEVGEDERNRLMSKALCVLHPATFREPFGLTLIESLACGAPVIGFNKGSVQEIIKNGKNGFIVEDTEEMIDAVEQIKTIDRSYCRSYALQHFSAQKMADEYENLYYKILST